MVRPAVIASLICVALVIFASTFGLCLQDDAFISFRYARNLVDGLGLVYNAGEHVEGYSNFLWTLLVAAAMKCHLDPMLFSVGAAVASSVGLALVSWKLAQAVLGPERPWLALAAPAWIALDPGLALESVQGLESSFFALLVTSGVLAEVRDRPGWMGTAVALACLTRPEGALVFAVLVCTRLLDGRADRGHRIAWGVVAAVLAGHLAFRLLYYGQPVPNTFYAKVGASSAQVGRGAVYLLAFARLHVVLVAAAVVGLASRRQRTVVALALTWLAYVAAVGGDFKGTFRFVLPVLGLLAVMGASGLARLPRPAALAALLLAAALDLPRGLAGARDAAALRSRDLADRMEVGAWLRDNVPPDTLLAIHSAGIVPYVSGLRTIDMWGLSDAHIARRHVEEMGSGTAGHEKTDYAYTFSLEPDLYLPEDDLLTDRQPTRLPVPADFPPDFEQRYTQVSVDLGERWLNMFERNRDGP